MDAAALIPAPDAIPVAWEWFEGLGILTFGLHLLLANALIGGAAIALVLSFKDKTNPMSRDLAHRLPTILALTVNFGVAPLLFLQVLYGQFLYTSAVLSALWWLAVIDLLIIGYYALYIHQGRQKKEATQGWSFLLLSLVLAVVIAFIFTNVMTMMLRPGTWSHYFMNRQGTLLNLFEPTLVPRFLHFVLASLAIGGLALALAAKYGANKGTPEAQASLETGMKWFTTLTMVQMAAGFWWLIALDRPVLLLFLGDSTGATLLLVVSVGLTFPLLAAGFRKAPLAALGWTTATVLAMTGLRAVIRSATLAPFFSPSSLTVTGETSPLVLFLVTLVIGLAVVAYMLKLFLRRDKEA